MANNNFFSNEFKDNPMPFWIASTPKTDYPALTEDINIDIAIVGGGLTGITSAYLLKKEGYKVALIDAGRIIEGTTGHTTAKITSQHGLVYSKILNNLGKEHAQQYADSNEAAIKFIANLIKEKNIECDFSWQSSYIYTKEDNYVEKIQKESETAAELGIKSTFLKEIPLPFKVKAAIRFDNQAQFHPRKYLLEIQKEIPGHGGYIFENTRIMDVKEGKPCTLVTEDGKIITAPKVIIASHYPCFDGKGMYFTRLYPERSYVLAVKIKEKYSGGMYITAEDPGRSLRSTNYNDEELVIIGGEHHKTGQGENMNNHYVNLKKFVMDTFTVTDIPWRWSTHDYSTPDDVPYIGNLTSNTPNVFVATGYKKWGMTTSTAAAIILKDLITTGKSPWADVYYPSRFNAGASAAAIIKENADVAKHLIKGKLGVPPNNVLIENGEGKIVDVDGQRAGAYRDNKGVLHIVDTTCTHVGCELNWNNAEKTWDCPCHGSRFTVEGDIVEGPAVHKLKHITDGKNEIDPNII